MICGVCPQQLCIAANISQPLRQRRPAGANYIMHHVRHSTIGGSTCPSLKTYQRGRLFPWSLAVLRRDTSAGYPHWHRMLASRASPQNLSLWNGACEITIFGNRQDGCFERNLSQKEHYAISQRAAEAP